jgi:hypothetical protein
MTDSKDTSLTVEGAIRPGQSLGNYGVVAALMNEFAEAVTALWTAYTDGTITQAEAAQGLEDAATEYAAIFKGDNPDFAPVPWRLEPTLKGKIVGWVPGIGPDGDVVQRYFKFLGRQVLQGAQAVQQGMAIAEAGPTLQGVLQDAAEKLSGVQP